jgi:hypothetical protein
MHSNKKQHNPPPSSTRLKFVGCSIITSPFNKRGNICSIRHCSTLQSLHTHHTQPAYIRSRIYLHWKVIFRDCCEVSIIVPRRVIPFSRLWGLSDITRFPAATLDKVYESATSHNHRAPLEIIIVIYLLLNTLGLEPPSSSLIPNIFWFKLCLVYLPLLWRTTSPTTRENLQSLQSLWHIELQNDLDLLHKNIVLLS